MPSGVGTTHHIMLGGNYYLIRPGSYVKKNAPQFGARFTSGDPDYNTLGMWQHWAQRCFIGGVDQDVWADDAMYDDGIGVDTTDHERVTLARDLLPGTGSNWGLSAASTTATYGWKTIVYNSKLYALTLPTTGVESKLWRYDAGATDGWTNITAFGSKDVCGRSIAVYDGKLFVGGLSVASGAPKVVYDDGALTSWSVLANPSGISATYGTVTAMLAFQQKLYVCYGRHVWRSKSNQTWDGNTEFYNANAADGSSNIVSLETHLGFLYMLSLNGHVHRTDGNSTFDIWSWDNGTQGAAIRSFDGKLFILTFEYTETTNVGYGVLYQMSGSAMTQLKRWGDGTNSNYIGNMVVYDRKLFYGASNGLGFAGSARPVFGVVAYDPIEDAHSIVASNMDATTYARGSAPYDAWIVSDQCFFGGQLFVFVRGHGAFTTPYVTRDYERGLRTYDVSAAGASAADTNGGYFTTSNYDAGTPGVLKQWRSVSVDLACPANTAIIIAYSLNNGATWTQWGVADYNTNPTRSIIKLYVDAQSASLKLRFTFRSTSASVTPIMYGYVVSYLPLPDPNWMWTFTIVLNETHTLLDGTSETITPQNYLDALSAAFRAQILLAFTDAEGDQWATDGSGGVLIYDMTVNLRNLEQPIEGEVQITLLEATET